MDCCDKALFLVNHSVLAVNHQIILELIKDLDTTQVSPRQNLDPDLVETEYMIQIDNRLGTIVSRDGVIRAVPDSIDDDNIAYYSFSQGTDQQFVFVNTSTENSVNEVIAGPRGTILEFSIGASLELKYKYLFIHSTWGQQHTYQIKLPVIQQAQDLLIVSLR